MRHEYVKRILNGIREAHATVRLPEPPIVPDRGGVGVVKRFAKRHLAWCFYPARWCYHSAYRLAVGLARADRTTWSRVACFVLWFVPPWLGRLVHHPPRPLPMRHCPRPHPRSALPRISIVVPSLNQGRYIGRTLESLLDQEYPELDLHVQDGGSTDGTLETLRRLPPGRVRWESRPDMGQAHAINVGFARTRGDVMAYLNADDLLLPGSLHRVARFFGKYPEVDVVYGHRILINDRNEEIGRWILPRHDGRVLRVADFVPQETLFWRREIWNRTGGALDERLGFAMDWDLLLRFQHASARFVRLNSFLGAFRVHDAQKTCRESHIGERETDLLRRRFLGHSMTPEQLSEALIPFLTRHLVLHYRYRCGLLFAS